MKERIITIRDIEDSIFDANLDSEYREALGHSLVTLEYVKKTPLRLHFGTPEERKEIRRVESIPLNHNQISEIIHLMMYEMRNDFQYGEFKPIANYYINISKEMEKENIKTENSKVEYKKPICNIHKAHGYMLDIIGLASKTLKQNNMYDESRKMIEKATLTYSYDEAYNVVGEYVEMIDDREKQEEDEEENDEEFE